MARKSALAPVVRVELYREQSQTVCPDQVAVQSDVPVVAEARQDLACPLSTDDGHFSETLHQRNQGYSSHPREQLSTSILCPPIRQWSTWPSDSGGTRQRLNPDILLA